MRIFDSQGVLVLGGDAHRIRSIFTREFHFDLRGVRAVNPPQLVSVLERMTHICGIAHLFNVCDTQ